MAKLKLNQITSDDLLEYLDSHSDFSFELNVLKMLRMNNLECEHGGYYEDPVTKKSREFDIRAVKTIEQYKIRLAIECKNIRTNFPILISCIPRHEQESYHQVAMVGNPKNDSHSSLLTIQQSRAKTLSIRGEYSLYKAERPVGKSTVQVGRTLDNSISANDSELFEKWGQCLSSATDLVSQAYWDGEDDGTDYLSTVIPFVVVPNGRLWTVTYDEEGNRISNPELTDRCSCFIDKDYEMGSGIAGTRMWLSHVEIVTYNGLREFVENYITTKEGLSKVLPTQGIIDAYDRSEET